MSTLAVLNEFMREFQVVKPEDADIVDWIHDSLRSRFLGSIQGVAVLSGKGHFAFIGPKQFTAIVSTPSDGPMMFIVSIRGNVSPVMCLINGIDTPMTDVQISFFSERMKLLRSQLGDLYGGTCPTCGIVYDMGLKQKFCDNCGQPKVT